MKKTIFILSAFLFLGRFCFGQTASTPPAPVLPSPAQVTYSADPSKVLTVGLSFPLNIWNDFLRYVNEGAGLDTDPVLTGQQISTIKMHSARVADSLTVYFNRFLANDKLRWQADTAAANKKLRATKK